MSDFLNAYRIYTEQTEPPQNFHVWTAMSTISALLGRKCFIPQGFFTVYPQLYVVLVGKPGTKKSSAMNIGKNLLRSIEGFPLAPESITRESLLDSMAENKMECELYGKPFVYFQCSAFASELSEFIGGKHINTSTISFLTAVWDEPSFEAKTRHSGKVKLHAPYFTLIGCCTPDWITSKLKDDIITDGFARRTIFVYEEDRNCLNPWPVDTPETIAALSTMEKECQRICQIKGQFTFTPRAREMWDIFYKELQEFADKQSTRTQSYYSSKHILVIKLCMCLSACYNNDRVVCSSILNLAITFFLETEHSLEQVFSGMGRNQLKVYHDKVLNFIAKKSQVSRRDIMREFANDLGIQEITETLEVLLEAGHVELRSHGVQQPPSYSATAKVKPKQAVNLLALASLLEPDPEESKTCPKAPEELPRDPVIEQRQRLRDSWRRVLAQGKLPLDKSALRPE